jgi:hypothetical protein
VTPSPILLVALLVAGLLALVPVARLRADGWSPPVLAAYWLVLVGLGVALVVVRVGFRILLPLLIVGYVAPIVIVRIRRRRAPGSLPRR